MERKVVSPDSALASDIFDQFCTAATLKSLLALHRRLCDTLKLRPTNFPLFYPKLKGKLRSWRAQALWTKFDKRISHKCYARGYACANSRVLIIGAGPCGLRAAIEAQLLGAKVVVVEMRDRISRNNVLHLWPFVIHDLRSLGAKKFFGKFCAGAIDHISIRQLQVILLKVALLLGVELHVGVGFKKLIPPPEDQSDRVGWKAEMDPPDHPVSQYEFDVLIGADGKRNTLDGFGRKEFRGKLAIAITANFLNRRSEAEARVEEISGVAFIFNQKFFRDLYQATGIDLENIVYYKDDTHYFVMTAKKHSLLDKGVIIADQSDTARLLHPDNVNKDALMEYAREAADFSTQYQLPMLEFAVNHYGQPDVAMFDFTSMYAAENASKVLERHGHRLLTQLVGDSLLEPFWPTGSGCARGFLSSMDACWALRGWGGGLMSPLEVAAERESIYRLLGQTTPENLSKDFASYTLEPHTRYPNLNLRAVVPIQVKNLIDTDNPASLEVLPTAELLPSKRRRKESQVHPDTLLMWLKRQVALYDSVKIENLTKSFRDGMALCAIVHRYRPELIDFASLKPEDAAANNQLAFDILQREMTISPVMSGADLAASEEPDELSMLSYLSQVYDAFRGEIPHLRHKTIDEAEEVVAPAPRRVLATRVTRPRISTSQRKRGSLERGSTPEQQKVGVGRLPRKRRSHDKDQDREARILAEVRRGGTDENFAGRIKEIEAKFKGTAPAEKKPRDLLRSIGKIERSDWNVAVIERKMEENKMGRSKARGAERVPKWSREKFADKFSAVEKKLRGRSKEDETAKFADIDNTLKRLDRKIKEGSVLDPTGPRGANKVSAMAEQLATKMEPTELNALAKSSSRGTVVLPQQGGSESCHFCAKRVYLMERLNAEGRFFHRGCFRCEYCNTSLRPNNYSFDRDGKYGSRFVCTQHFGLPGYIRGARARRKSEDLRAAAAAEPGRAVVDSATPSIIPLVPQMTTPLASHEDKSELSVGATPERVEFENLAMGSEEDKSEARPASVLAEMDEEAWTDHNFGASCADDDSSSEEEDSSLSDSEDDDAEAYEEALAEPLSVEETRQLAETWKRRYSQRSQEAGAIQERGDGSEISEEDEEQSSEEEWSCERDENEDEDSSTATEGDAVARELLRQEERLRERAMRRRHRSHGSDTEVASDCTSTETDSDEDLEEEEEENLATEIETDSEFELDSSLPTILIDSELQVCHVKTTGVVKGNLNRTPANRVPPSRRVPSKPSAPPPEMTPAVLKHRPNNFPGLDLQLKRKELLNRTHSTEGIASKMSLELKKRYLLGGDSSAFNKNVQKSGSASALDSRFRSFVDQISEQQKLLQPAAQPSPTMQAYLDGQAKLSPNRTASPLLQSMSTSNILQGNRADSISKLPRVPSSFIHICGKKETLLSPPEIKVTPEIDDEATPIVETKEMFNELAQNNTAHNYNDKILDLVKDDINKINNLDESIESSKILDLEKEKLEDLTPNVEDDEIIQIITEEIVETNILDPDYRPRSPAHETSIIVPDISEWKDKKVVEVVAEQEKKTETEEESSEESESSSEYDEDSVEEVPQIKNVPRLEITDSEGGIMHAENPPPQDLSPEKPECETELSDWAQDVEENSVGDFDEFQLDTKNITFRKGRQLIGNPTLALEDDLSEGSFTEDVPKVDIMIVSDTKTPTVTEKMDAKSVCEECPKIDVMSITDTIVPKTIEDFSNIQEDNVNSESMKPIGATIDDIDFMDSGDDNSDIENTSSSPEKSKPPIYKKSETKNVPLIEGYRQLNDEIPDVIPANDSSTTESISKSSDDFGTTPDTELENLVLVEAINAKLAKTSDEESLLLVDTDTTTSDVTTIVLNDVNQNMATKTSQTKRPFVDPSYEAHVRRLQGRISPFSNAKDSIDIRKSRKSSTNSSSSTPSPSHSSKDEFKINKSSPVKSIAVDNEVIHKQELKIAQNGSISFVTTPLKITENDIITINETINKPSNNIQLNIKEIKTNENSKLKEIEKVTPVKIITNTPSTSRKLEEISKERSKQKDLISDLVMSKLGTNSLERKRSTSGGPGIRKRLSSRSPTGSPRCSLFGPPVPPPPAQEPPPPVPPPPANFHRIKIEDMESVMPKYEPKPIPLVNNVMVSPKHINRNINENSILRPSKVQENHIADEDDDDVFVTPRNVNRNASKTRPISVYASFKAPESCKIPEKKLPDTPLTHPEAFSCPDIRRALFAEENREKVRREARARARLLSDQELGLSPEDTLTLSSLRDKARRKLDQENVTPVAPPRTKKKSDSSKFYVDNEHSIEETQTDPVVKRSTKKPKDRERRKSLIQAMSEFFTRKKDGTSPSPSSPSKDDSGKSSPSKSPSKFRLKSKDKSREGKTAEEEMPPPLPPPPQGYQGCQPHVFGRDDSREESPSEGEDSRAASCSLEGSSLRRSSRSAKKMARQAQLKRLRMAHELQRQLEELEEKQKVLESRGVALEKALRGEDRTSPSSGSGGEVALLQEWFELMRERSELRRYERELGVRAQELELQERHAKLQADLRDRMALDDASKSSAEVAEEGRILGEMLEIVQRRDSLIALLEEDRQRYVEEDKDLEAQMLAKGLRLTPLRKESHV